MEDDFKFKCSQCEDELKDKEFYTIFRVKFITDKNNHDIGLKTLLNEIGDYLMEKGSHLSASEILLLRPDVVYEFLSKRCVDETVQVWYLEDYFICFDCYEEYKELVPLI